MRRGRLAFVVGLVAYALLADWLEQRELELEWRDWLDSAQGRFEQWYAERRDHGRADDSSPLGS